MKKCVLPLIASMLLTATNSLLAQGSAFTYQGQLNSAGGGVTGLYDFQFAVFDSPSGGTQIGSTMVTNAVAVVNGLFTVTLDFGANIFTGNARWLDLAAHTNNSPNAFVSMTPRQQLTATPYAIYAGSAAGVYGLTVRPVSGTDASDFLAGSPGNAIDAGVRGAVIAGGGTTTTALTNHISSDFSTISGGDGNTIQAGAQNSFIGAGQYNVITNGSYYSVIVGGSYNSEANSCYYSFIGGGGGNRLSSSVGVLVGGSDNSLSGSYSFLGGGENNQVISASDSFLGGGSGNTIQQFDGDSVLVGGQQNSVGAIYSFLGGGLFNTNNGQYASIPGGYKNLATGNYSFAAGQQAHATNNGAFVWADSQNASFASTNNDSFNVRAQGGVHFLTGEAGMTVDGAPVGGAITGLTIQPNPADGSENLIAGSQANFVSNGVVGATISGGGATNYGGLKLTNAVIGDFGTVAGGSANKAGFTASVGGGQGNTASGYYASAPGGVNNLASGYASLAAGQKAQATNDGSFVWSDISSPNAFASTANNQFSVRAAGGARFVTDGAGISIDGPIDGAITVQQNSDGLPNIIEGAANNSVSSGTEGATISGGGGVTQFIMFDVPNTVNGGWGNVGGGAGNTAGIMGTVPGGFENTASGQGSFAAGQFAQATNDGAFVWADSQQAPFYSTNNDSFNLRAQGGVRFVTAIDGNGNPTAGISLASGGGSWSSLSDRNAKKDFAPVNSQTVLDQVVPLPLSTWSYKSESGVRHIGPMAQDFHAAFQVGEDDRHITEIDESGVALAAIQGLNEKLNEKDAEIAELKARLDALEKMVRK